MRKTVAGFRNILEVSGNLNLAGKVILLIEQKWFINNLEKLSSWTSTGLEYFMIFKWFQSQLKINLNSLKYFYLSEKAHSVAPRTLFAYFLYRLSFYWNIFISIVKRSCLIAAHLRSLTQVIWNWQQRS